MRVGSVLARMCSSISSRLFFSRIVCPGSVEESWSRSTYSFTNSERVFRKMRVLSSHSRTSARSDCSFHPARV